MNVNKDDESCGVAGRQQTRQLQPLSGNVLVLCFAFEVM